MAASAGDAYYYFPPGHSMARRVHGERSVGLLYGQRALLIGALEPLTYTGTMLSTNAGDQPFTRLARTAKIQETVFLGTREEADKALGAVHRLHERIKGSLPEAAGAHPAGATYSAFDPELMLWTLAVIADSGRAMYEAMVRPLSEGEREALWQDYVRFGELFGLPRQRGSRQLPRVPRLVRQERLASPDLHATPHALEMAPLVAFEQPVPAAARGNLVAQNLVIKGTLPPRVREIFGIGWTRAHEAAFRSLTAGPPPRPPRLPAAAAARPQRRSSSTSSPRPSAGAAAPPPRSSPREPSEPAAGAACRGGGRGRGGSVECPRRGRLADHLSDPPRARRAAALGQRDQHRRPHPRRRRRRDRLRRPAGRTARAGHPAGGPDPARRRRRHGAAA